MKKLLLGIVFASSTQIAVAQEAAAEQSFLADPSQQEVLMLTILGLIGLLLLMLGVFIYLVIVLKKLVENPDAYSAENLEAEESITEKLTATLTDAVPVEEEERILTSHEYDGIRELDNNLPPWWKWLFYATIAFAGLYLYGFYIGDWMVQQADEYENEMVMANRQIEAYRLAQANNINEVNVTLLDSEAALKAGAKIYAANCLACHAADLGGGVGPNLVDEYWIHGGSVKDIFATLKYGVKEKGMISWEGKLTPLQMQQTASFILSMQGTQPANPKEPQGELEEPQVPTEGEDGAEVSMR